MTGHENMSQNYRMGGVIHMFILVECCEKKCCVCHRLFSCQAAQAGDFFYCSKECYEKDMERNPSEYSYIVIPQKQAVISSEESAKKEEKYIQKNGLCSICRTSYKNCERLLSNFTASPKGAVFKGSIVIECPKFKK